MCDESGIVKHEYCGQVIREKTGVAYAFGVSKRDVIDVDQEQQRPKHRPLRYGAGYLASFSEVTIDVDFEEPIIENLSDN